MVKFNIGQSQRAETLQEIRTWILMAQERHPDQPIDREALVRKICIDIGATVKKVHEYLNILGVPE